MSNVVLNDGDIEHQLAGGATVCPDSVVSHLKLCYQHESSSTLAGSVSPLDGHFAKPPSGIETYVTAMQCSIMWPGAASIVERSATNSFRLSS